MWICTTDGYFSAVKYGKLICLRARCRKHLESLGQSYGGVLAGCVIEKSKPEQDYPWRMFMRTETFTMLVASIATSINYDNFKNECVADQPYSDFLHDTWSRSQELTRHESVSNRKKKVHGDPTIRKGRR